MDRFLTFKKFHTIEQAQELTAILNEHTIPFSVEDNSADLSDTITGQDIAPRVILKIAPEHFEKVKEFLNNIAEKEIEHAESDHYLFSFTNNELLELLMEPDKWSEFDCQLAKKILNTRGIVVNKELQDALVQKRLNDLSQQEKMHIAWLLTGYITAVLGGIIGIIIGLTLWISKRTLPNGVSIYVYPPDQRNHGKLIAAIGITMAVLIIYARIKWES